jgi:hypothetical protein
MQLKTGTTVRQFGSFSLFLFSIIALLVYWVAPEPAYSQSGSAPAFPSGAVTRSIAENSLPGHAIGKPVVAHDPDQGERLTYSLHGRDAAFFEIEEQSGQLKSGESLDYETRPTYLVTVLATDPGGLNDSVPVTINVTNADEMGELTLSASDVRVGALLNADLTDPDGVSLIQNWEWAVSPDGMAWTAIENAGAASYVPATEDAANILRVRVKYNDGHGFFKTAELLTGRVLLPTEKNHPPDFPYFESGVRGVLQAVSVGENVGAPILAGDLNRDILTYQLEGEAARLFEIDRRSGQLRVKAPLHVQLQSRYFGVVNVTDGRGGSDSLTLRVDVVDLPSPTPPPATPVPPSEDGPGIVSIPAPTPMTAPLTGSVAGSRPDSPSAIPASSIPTPGSNSSVGATPMAPGDQVAATSQNSESSNSDSDREEVLAVAMQYPPGPPAALGDAGGLDSAGQALAGAANSGFSFPAWLMGLLAALFLAAALLVGWKVWENQRRKATREITMPPPSFGPLRRIAPLPFLYSSPTNAPKPGPEGAG